MVVFILYGSAVPFQHHPRRILVRNALLQKYFECRNATRYPEFSVSLSQVFLRTERGRERERARESGRAARAESAG